MSDVLVALVNRARICDVRRVLAVVICVVVFGGLGFSLSHAINPPPGPEHHCQAGAPSSACHYPADQFSWSIGWTIFGLIAGLCVGLVIQGSLSRRAR